MRARPVRYFAEEYSFIECPADAATHLHLLMHGHFREQYIRIKGDRPVWEWNGDTEKPTLSPSILTTCDVPGDYQRCHCFVRDGLIEYLPDCTHEFCGQVIPLREHS